METRNTCSDTGQAGALSSRLVMLVRHGEVLSGGEHSFLGSTDLALSDNGRRQARALLDHMPGTVPLACLCSPSRRAQETARLATQSIEVNMETNSDLREIDFGEWEGLTFEQIKIQYPEEVSKWALFDPEFSFPKGEKLADYLDRIKEVGSRLASRDEEWVVAFTHGGVIRSLICHWLGLDPARYLLFDVQPASITTLRLFNDRGVLVGLDNSLNTGSP